MRHVDLYATALVPLGYVAGVQPASKPWPVAFASAIETLRLGGVKK
ncbi:MAG: hypothetical protein ABR567_12870 [Myxococcales bacterium]